MKEEQISTYKVITLGNNEPFNLEELRALNSDSYALIIQLYTHGGEPGIQGPNGIIAWTDVIKLVSGTRTRNRIRLDLCGVCSSYFIEDSLNGDNKIDEVWVSSNETPWQSVYNWSKHSSTFNDFLNSLSEDEESARYRDFYKKLK